MKAIKSLITALIVISSVMICSTKLIAQKTNTEELKVKTSAVCGMCKETLEKNLAFEKGIRKSNLDVDSKVITVTYNPEKITPEKIRLVISKIGYDADDIPADKKAHSKLDDCCKKGAVCNDK